MIIIEGPDGAGKTYTAEWLSSQLRIPIHHAGGPPKRAEEIQERMDVFWKEPYKIFDRCIYFSEQIYGPILRSEYLLSKIKISNYRNQLKGHRAKVVYCRPPLEIILSVVFQKIISIFQDL